MRERLDCLIASADDFVDAPERGWILHLIVWIETEQSERPPFETVAAYFLPSGLRAVDCGTWWTEEESSAWSNTATRRTRRDGKRGVGHPSADAPEPKRARKGAVATNSGTTPHELAAKTRVCQKPAKAADNDAPKVGPTNRQPNPFTELQLDGATFEQARDMFAKSKIFPPYVSSNYRTNILL